MYTILKVEKLDNGKLNVSWPATHPKFSEINHWLKTLSPGYVEYLLKFEKHPHCDSCRDMACDEVGSGDDACRAYKFGLEW